MIFPQLNYKIVLDFGKTIEELVIEGKFDGSDPNITSDNFPISGDVNWPEERTVYLVSFGKSISSMDAVDELAKMALRPVLIRELLSFGIYHPDLQRANWIIGLGSSCYVEGLRLVGTLWSEKSYRYAGLGLWQGDDWSKNWVFAACQQ